jgi:hypothetical protein
MRARLILVGANDVYSLFRIGLYLLIAEDARLLISVTFQNQYVKFWKARRKYYKSYLKNGKNLRNCFIIIYGY